MWAHIIAQHPSIRPAPAFPCPKIRNHPDQAAVFRRLRDHLLKERDVQNIDLILAGFCRNCLADWYGECRAPASP
jgi:hypothetical protein